jgi:hypothetical protein
MLTLDYNEDFSLRRIVSVIYGSWILIMAAGAFTCYLRPAGRGGVGREVLHHPSHLSMANKIAVHAHLGDNRGPPSPPAM